MKKFITFIGAGNMAEALISGFLKKNIVPRNCLTAFDIKGKRLIYLKKKYEIRTEKKNEKALRNADIIFLAVKPQQIKDVLTEISVFIKKSQLIISLAAGVTTKFIEKYLKKGTPVVRSMPNMPALVGEGATGICKGAWAKNNHLEIAEKLFLTVGKVLPFNEKNINAVTALSGSGPAYVFYLTEALEKAGRSLGLSKKASEILSRQTVFGAGKLLKESGLSPKDLRVKVTSPGGTTAAAINYFEEKRFLSIFYGALKKAEKRARELSSPR
ncbi:MAG: pyrroline-5-carboxylate reductase [Elusimicrobia bacterium]|nr:pyrroline-5-carboxylate reductase [Elusimicrobiota bacterium]